MDGVHPLIPKPVCVHELGQRTVGLGKVPGKGEMVVEAAINSAADRLVTRNVADFGPARRFGLTIATPQAFLKEIAR
jgi:hypothetical protein